MKTVVVGEATCPVTEDMGFNQDAGMRAMFVNTPFGVRVVVRDGGRWRFWTDVDRAVRISTPPCGQ